MKNFVAEGGIEVTQAMLDKWSEQAECAHKDPSLIVTYVENFKLPVQPMKNKTFRLPSSLVKELEEHAKAQGVSQSDIVRQALRQFESNRLYR